MSNINKILAVVFAILIMAIVAEVGFFLSQKQKTSSQSTITPTSILLPTPTLSQSSPSAKLAINNRSFLSPDRTKKQVSRQYEGKVIDINTKDEVVHNFSSPGAKETIGFAVSLRIQGTSKIPYQLYYFKEELQKTGASFSNIKIGDTVRIEETIDFSLPIEQMVIKLLVNKL